MTQSFVDSVLRDAQPEPEFDQEFVADMGALVKSVLFTDEYKPPLLPETAIALSEMARKRDTSLRDVEACVARDPIVAARVVAVASSAFYSRGQPVKSLRAAITRLGLHEVRDVAFQVVAQTRIFRIPGYDDRMRALFESSQASGLIAREVCRVLSYESEVAYLCGLLHDMGEAIILGVIGESWHHRGLPVPALVNLKPVIEHYHAQAGGVVCRKWGLPDIISDSVRFHHQPKLAAHSDKMARVLAVTDLLLGHAGIGCERALVDPINQPLFFELDLSPGQALRLIDYSNYLGENRGDWAV